MLVPQLAVKKRHHITMWNYDFSLSADKRFVQESCMASRAVTGRSV